MPDCQAAEAQYFRDTQIYPIMHALVIKTAVLDAHPWVAMNVYKAFLQVWIRAGGLQAAAECGRTVCGQCAGQF